MSTATDVDALRRMMPPPENGGRAVGWDGMAQTWGRPFPLDYQRFMETYGAGVVGDVLVVVAPQQKAPLSEAGWDGMVEETGNAEDAWADSYKTPELEGTSPRLIAWAATSSAGGSEPIATEDAVQDARVPRLDSLQESFAVGAEAGLPRMSERPERKILRQEYVVVVVRKDGDDPGLVVLRLAQAVRPEAVAGVPPVHDVEPLVPIDASLEGFMEQDVDVARIYGEVPEPL